jgi:hypothetical protein
MDFNKFFSPFEKMNDPDTYFIGEYGFTTYGIYEKLKDMEDEGVALNYLINMRDKLIIINQELQPYSFSNFYDLKKFKWNVKITDDIPSDKKESYSEANARYNSFIKNIDSNKIKNNLVKEIIEDIKYKRRSIDVLSLQADFSTFIRWLDGIIRKINVIQEFSENDEQIDEKKEIGKIVWQGKYEDFAALFDKLFELKFFVFKKNKFQVLAKHFSWIDGEMEPEKLKHLRNNIKNKSDTHQISDELKNLKFD